MICVKDGFFIWSCQLSLISHPAQLFYFRANGTGWNLFKGTGEAILFIFKFIKKRKRVKRVVA